MGKRIFKYYDYRFGMDEHIYEPAEDSFLLEKLVKEHSFGKVLDVGTGSGIQAQAAARNLSVKSVLALDIQPEVIAHCKKKIADGKITFVQSDLFSSVKKGNMFDTIIFNPPYLPADEKDPHPALDGGPKGHETLQRFFDDVPMFLAEEGIILIVFSSITKKDVVDSMIRHKMLDFELLDKQHVSFEDLYVYKIEKNAVLRELAKKGVSLVSYFAKGKRGKVFSGVLKGKKVAIKVKNPSSQAMGKIEQECIMLRKLEKHRIAPKVLVFAKDYLVMEFVDGVFIGEFLENSRKKDAKTVLKRALRHMRLLDSLNITKEEMHHPHKHVLVTAQKKPMLIDFERAHYDERPSNVTQFCQFLTSSSIAPILREKGIHIGKQETMKLAQEYKKGMSRKVFERILALLE
jgi:release factor glutamine methyltransferase